jgi:hypothetical protein
MPLFRNEGKKVIMRFSKRWSLVISLGAILLCIPFDSSAQLMSGKKLAADMQEFEKAERQDPSANYQQAYFFMGYVAGVYDLSDDTYMYPVKPTIRQICSIVAKYLRENPKEWDLPADLVITKALKKAFPK